MEQSLEDYIILIGTVFTAYQYQWFKVDEVKKIHCQDEEGEWLLQQETVTEEVFKDIYRHSVQDPVEAVSFTTVVTQLPLNLPPFVWAAMCEERLRLGTPENYRRREKRICTDDDRVRWYRVGRDRLIR